MASFFLQVSDVPGILAPQQLVAVLGARLDAQRNTIDTLRDKVSMQTYERALAEQGSYGRRHGGRNGGGAGHGSKPATSRAGLDIYRST